MPWVDGGSAGMAMSPGWMLLPAGKFTSSRKNVEQHHRCTNIAHVIRGVAAAVDGAIASDAERAAFFTRSITMFGGPFTDGYGRSTRPPPCDGSSAGAVRLGGCYFANAKRAVMLLITTSCPVSTGVDSPNGMPPTLAGL